MKIGLWSDSHNFPSIPLMKLSAYHKRLGDKVEHYVPLDTYDIVYASKTFSFTPDIDDNAVVRTDELIKGGTGYCISVQNGKEIFDKELNHGLAPEVENICPDYGLYPQLIKNKAYGFLTRGCPRNCGFCIVGKKEGLKSCQVADLSDFWNGQKDINLCDPNILACKNHERLLEQLIQSKAKVDFNQGLDIRLVNSDNIKLLNRIKTPMIHFAWDNPQEDLIKYFDFFASYTAIKSDRNRSVYVLTNYNSTHDEDLYRIYTLRDLGFTPYVMIYRKETAPQITRHLQRWCNNRFIFRSCEDFKDFNAKRA